MFNAHDLRVINRSMQACFGLSKRRATRCLPQCTQKYTRNSQPPERQRCPPFAIPLFPALPLGGRDGPMRFAQYGFDAKVITRNLPAAILHATPLPYNSPYSSSRLATPSCRAKREIPLGFPPTAHPQLAYSIPLRFSGFLTPYSEFSTFHSWLQLSIFHSTKPSWNPPLESTTRAHYL